MEFKQLASATFKRVSNTYEGAKRFAKLERILAGVCLFIPAFLILFDDGPIRNSISAYDNMEENQFFYFPLTVAAMLFVVNGVVKKEHDYNTLLGVLLVGVILFNHEDASLRHGAFAAAFFGGNAVVILKYSSKEEKWFKRLLVAAIVLAMAGCFVFKLFTLFWAEWFSFALIALHYILESWGVID
jgi:hypothetical protein